MGNFEKLSVLVIGVIIVMILVVALYTWTDDPAEPEANVPVDGPTIAGLSGDGSSGNGSAGIGSTGGLASPAGEEAGDDGWLTWVEETETDRDPADRTRPVGDDEILAGGEGPADEMPPSDVPAEPAAERTYTVKQGQTLSHISLEVYGTIKHWPKIAERNNIDPARLQKGQVLIIPAIAATTPGGNNKPAGGGALAATGAGPRPGTTYTVRDGDTMQKISQSAFGTIERWDDIWLENLERVEDPRFLRSGLTLQIPN